MPDFPQPIPVDDALRPNDIQIDVPPGEILTIGPFEQRYTDAFRIAEVQSFEGLQALGLVPQGISEQDATDALTADDREFRQRRRDVGEPTTCSCQDPHAVQARPVSRSRIQPHLTEALSSPYRRLAALDDPGVIQVYGHLSRWFDKPARYLVGVVRADNIIIGYDAVLVMSPTVSLVDVNLIDIGAGGRLRFQGSSVNVRCETLNGRSESSVPGPHGPPPGHTPTFPPPTWPPLRSAEDIAEKYLPGFAKEQRTAPATGE